MSNSLRTVVLLMLLALSQVALGGFVRQTMSNRLLENKTPKPVIVGDYYVPEVVLMPDESVVLKDTPSSIDVLSNDQFSLYSFDWTTFNVLDQPAFGIAEVNGNEIQYSPNEDFTGWDHFTYSICDTYTPSTCYHTTARVYVVALPEGPTAKDDAEVLSDAPNSIIVDVLDNDYDKDGPFANWASLVIIGQPDHGVATVTQDYKIEYTPIWSSTERFHGIDHIQYQVCDIEFPTLCDIADVAVTVDTVCTSCTACGDISEIFEDHLSAIHKVFRTEVLSM